MGRSFTRIAIAILFSTATLVYGQTAKDDIKKAGQDTKSAAKHTGKATARTAHTAKVKVKHGTNKAASKVEEKTRDK